MNRYDIKLPRVTRRVPQHEVEWAVQVQEQRFGQLPYAGKVTAEGKSCPGYRVREVREHTAHQARHAVHKHSLYLHLEHSWTIQYPTRTDALARAFLWIDVDSPNLGLGSVCFYPRGSLLSGETWWGLQWTWFHPYVRGKGLLGRAWPYFLKRFGSFSTESPRSAAMEHFLAKHGGDPYEARSADRLTGLETPFSTD